MSIRPLLHRFLMRVRPAFVAVALKKFFRIQRIVVSTPSGKMLIDPVSVFGQAVQASEGYEHEMLQTLDAYISDGGSFLDIGANEGFFSVHASKRAGSVIAVEPQRRAADCIRNNLALNAVTNVRIVEQALGKAEEERDFHFANDTNTGSSGFVNMVRYRTPSEKVHVSTLDALMETLGWPAIDLAKIDIEGAEYELLLGASETLKRGLIKHIAIELHPRQLSMQGYSSEQVLKLLSDNAYHKRDGAPTLVYARNTARAAVS